MLALHQPLRAHENKVGGLSINYLLQAYSETGLDDLTLYALYNLRQFFDLPILQPWRLHLWERTKEVVRQVIRSGRTGHGPLIMKAVANFWRETVARAPKTPAQLAGKGLTFKNNKSVVFPSETNDYNVAVEDPFKCPPHLGEFHLTPANRKEAPLRRRGVQKRVERLLSRTIAARMFRRRYCEYIGIVPEILNWVDEFALDI
jgi:hypothetical protein